MIGLIRGSFPWIVLTVVCPLEPTQESSCLEDGTIWKKTSQSDIRAVMLIEVGWNWNSTTWSETSTESSVFDHSNLFHTWKTYKHKEIIIYGKNTTWYHIQIGNSRIKISTETNGLKECTSTTLASFWIDMNAAHFNSSVLREMDWSTTNTRF